MRHTHFHRWRPLCAACRAAGRDAPAVELTRVERETDDEILDGILLCPEPMCQREYPIIDGIPILVADVRSYVQHQLVSITARDDLPPGIESLLGDCAESGSDYDRERYHLGCYGRGHYGDLDPERPGPAALVELLDRLLALLPAAPTGSWVDVGCSVGRGTFELAARTRELTLGIDLNYNMVRMARRVARGRVRHPLRRVGLVYDRRDFAAELPGADLVDFWVSDATGTALPEAAFAGALSLNVIDCVPSPAGHLIETARLVQGGGHALWSTPYDWSTGATPLEAWLGGHSQRSEDRGDSARILRRLLDGGLPPELSTGLRIIAEDDDAPWTVYLHERASMQYRAHLLATVKSA